MTYTLVGDGTSDRVLIPILTWSLKRFGVGQIVEQWADFGRIPHQANLTEKLESAMDLYPCDLLFVHRDAEAQHPDLRLNEITAAATNLTVNHVPVIPVKMTEAWLLHDESAIRCAAGNPNGHQQLNLPQIPHIEAIPDPKYLLYDALIAACGLNARRRGRFRPQERVHTIPNYISSYEQLQALPAFAALQTRIQGAVALL